MARKNTKLNKKKPIRKKTKPKKKSSKRKGKKKITTTKRKGRKKTTTTKRKGRKKTTAKKKGRKKSSKKKRSSKKKKSNKKKIVKKVVRRKSKTSRQVKRFCDLKFTTLNLPSESFMKSNGKSRFAYAVLLFPDPKSKLDKYMDGCIGVALGLRKQKTKADLVCMCTPDVTEETKNILRIVYDRVVTVPYILPHEDLLLNIRDSYKYVFTKFWVLNKNVFPYEKVCLVDSDIIPIKFYDTLFQLNTPAGIIEPPRHKYEKTWDYMYKKYRCSKDFAHGNLVPRRFTDLWNPEAGDSNAGLWVLSPDNTEFNEIVNEIKRDPREWMGPDKQHKGFYMGVDNIVQKYGWPEQQYLTVRYSGRWTSIGYEYASWCFQHSTSLGIHYVLRKVPWLNKQTDDSCVEKYYDAITWGMKHFPELKNKVYKYIE